MALESPNLGRIGRRILLWFAVVALLPVLFMGWQGYQAARQAIEGEVFLHMQAVAVSKQRTIEQWFKERQSDIRVLAATPQLIQSLRANAGQGPDVESAQSLLLNYLRQSDAYAEICLHDGQGAPVACTINSPGFGGDDSRGDMIRGALRSAEAVISPIYLRAGVGPSLHMACAVHDSAGRSVGVVITTLTLAQTLNPLILDTTGLGSTGQAYLLDDQKVMLTPSRFMNHPDPLTHTMDSEGIRAALLLKSNPDKPPGAGVYGGYDGHAVLGAWTYLPAQGWALIVEMNADEAFAPLEELKKKTLMVAVITLGMIFIVAWIVSQSISMPIRRLADASVAVSRGDLNQRVPINLNDELGELARRFNQMVASLKDYQLQIVRTERLAAIGELAASVVHEIRNPLSSVKMNLQILEAKCANDEITTEQFGIARAQAEKVERLLVELLDYAKPARIEPREIALGRLIEDGVQQVRHTLGKDFSEVLLEVSDPDLTLRVDPERLEQVLSNLLQNAAQAVSGQGRIVIRAGRKTTDDRQFVAISIADNGSGIRPEHLPHVFDPFFTTRKEGTGLGLSIAKKIVEAHRGQINVLSSPGTGTTVDILIPAM